MPLFDLEGIIPAYAGSTRRAIAYPGGPGGSSPHTRGALPSRELFSLAVRIIPAYAGSTTTAS